MESLISENFLCFNFVIRAAHFPLLFRYVLFFLHALQCRTTQDIFYLKHFIYKLEAITTLTTLMPIGKSYNCDQREIDGLGGGGAHL